MKMKLNISAQNNETKQLPPILEKLRKEAQGYRVPDGYFDSLSPRIVDSINKRENRSYIQILFALLRKPLIWAPAMATVVVAIFLIFANPAKNTTNNQVADEWAQINLAYDESYAQEALFAESNTIDKELESSSINNIGIADLTQNEPSVSEINEYLKEHENDLDILNEY
jgi:hypothetical protein